MKALVLSGGGSKGAFVGGMLEYMKLVLRREYDIYSGTSTGSLLQTLTAINDFKSLREGYTTMGIDDIYETSPFKKAKTPEEAKIRLLSILKMQLFRSEPTFGDSSKLLDLVHKFFPLEKYKKSLEMGKNIVTCVTNLSKVRSEYYSSMELGISGYDEFCDWSWISTNAVPFTSLVKRNGDYYADGGFMEHLPIQIAIDMGATEIDCISTKPINYSGDTELEIKNSLELIERIIDIMMWEGANRDLDTALYKAKEKDVTINIYHLPRKLTKNSMYFDKDTMNSWWDEGYEYMKGIGNKNNNCKVVKIKSKKTKSSLR